VGTGFAGKTALITGAGRGIGRAIALGLADAGAGLILLARSAGQLDETRAMLLGRGTGAGRIRVVAADPGDEEQRGRAARTAIDDLFELSRIQSPRPTAAPASAWRSYAASQRRTGAACAS
jgi:NAD(P)-dependent dehydrogenase (short-subunit alcohol dehydrogenase family)